jgi:DNA polymerase bacteriophage-type
LPARSAWPKEKDEAGKRLMREMARPRRPKLEEDPDKLYWFDDADRLQRLYAYCKQDVVAVRAIHGRIGLLTEAEQAIWIADQRINDRGIGIDRALAEGAVKIGAAALATIDAEMDALTEGEIGSAKQVEKLLGWLGAQGVALERARVEDVDDVLKRTDLAANVRRVLELRRDGAHIAGAKFSAMLTQAGDGDRVRGSFKYHGAATGRWTAHGVQPQNFKKPNGLDIAAAIGMVSAGDYEAMKAEHANPLAVVGSVARAAIVAAPGHRLIAADFSGIESRVLAWLAGETSKLKLWADFDAGGDDPYAVLGLRMGFPKDTARETGKVADLAFGYMGGVGAYRKFGDADAPEDDIRRLQRAWRNAHLRTVALWYALDRAAKRAVAKPGVVARVNDRVAFCADGTFLRMRLPSGRKIAYPFARNEAGTDKFDRPATVVHFMDNAGGKWTDARAGQGAWPGLWAENVVQAVARDLLAAAMMRLEAAGYPIVLHVHDEIVAEVPDGFGTDQEFVRLITELPGWADGLPVGAKVRSGPRFVEVGASSAKLEEPPPNEDDDGAIKLNSPPWADDAPPIADAPAPAAKVEAPRPSADWDYARGERDTGGRIATYEYPNEAGENYHRKFRTSTHQFPQQHWDGRRWVGGGPPSKEYFLYGLHQLLAAPLDAPVYVTEGEKDRDALAALGLISVTNPNGAGKFSRDFTREQLDRWFKGRTVVYAPEDNDAKGRQHVDDIGRTLSDLGCEVRIVAFRDMPEKNDVSDWLAMGHAKAELLARPWVKWAPPQLQSVCAANVVMRIMTWLWPSRFALGELGILAGLPDEGKGQVFAFMTATVTRGGAWPCDEGRAPKGNVIILTAEDDLATTVVPRLKAAGADLGRVHVVQMVAARGKDGERMFSLVDDLDLLRQKIAAVGDVRMVLVDPISAYLGVGKVDSFRTTDVRAVLAPVMDLARELEVAFIGIMHFNKKTDVTNALLRISDSLAFGAAARHVYAVVDDNENDRKVLVKGKNNHAPRDQKALAYKFAVREVATDPETGAPIIAPYIVWEPEPVDVTAVEAMAAANEGRPPAARDKAIKFLQNELAVGPRAAKELTEMAEANDISKRTLKRAKSELGVMTTKDGLDGGWTWKLPEEAAPESAF